MSDDYQRVEPTPFDAAPQTAASAPTQSAATATRPAWLYPALGGLGVAAIVVIFLLPTWVDNKPPSAKTSPLDSTNAASAEASRTSAQASKQEGREAASPFADAVEAKARAAAQVLLEELIDVQENLAERGVELWAPDEIAAVAAEALTGDEQYRVREFESAIATYESALDKALVLEQSIPQRLATQIEATRAAIEALNQDAAAAALSLAETLDPLDTSLGALRERTQALPDVRVAVEESQLEAANGALGNAVTSMQAAAELDPAHDYVANELSRLKNALTEQQFSAAMSEGYAALDESRFDNAEKRFRAASKLKQGSSEAAAALQELKLARTAATLRSLQQRADRALESEDFNAAIKLYNEAAGIDSSLRYAREGIAFAAPRAELDKQLTAILDKPGRLVDNAILREAQNSVAQTQALGELGPKLTEKLRSVEQTLAVASTPLRIGFQSDGLTSVTVYKVRRLGTFESASLDLRPGEYTAVGTRRGYRDARVIFTVRPGESRSIYIACDETI